MRLLIFRRGSRIKFGVERDGHVRPLATVGYATDTGFFSGGDRALQTAHSLLDCSGLHPVH